MHMELKIDTHHFCILVCVQIKITHVMATREKCFTVKYKVLNVLSALRAASDRIEVSSHSKNKCTSTRVSFAAL